jgi:hypothetical protein
MAMSWLCLAAHWLTGVCVVSTEQVELAQEIKIQAPGTWGHQIRIAKHDGNLVAQTVQRLQGRVERVQIPATVVGWWVVVLPDPQVDNVTHKQFPEKDLGGHIKLGFAIELRDGLKAERGSCPDKRTEVPYEGGGSPPDATFRQLTDWFGDLL